MWDTIHLLILFLLSQFFPSTQQKVVMSRKKYSGPKFIIIHCVKMKKKDQVYIFYSLYNSADVMREYTHCDGKPDRIDFMLKVIEAWGTRMSCVLWNLFCYVFPRLHRDKLWVSSVRPLQPFLRFTGTELEILKSLDSLGDLIPQNSTYAPFIVNRRR